ncbi:hypothetical protein, partial [Bradyrhizobium sp. 159]|uniref:hypothetical protein n=1 Tax=Bradyrhizobium sp. 159 TaxID=2782632 RepID=UPI001FFB22B0
SPRAGGVNHPDRAIQSIPRKSSPGTGDPIVTLTKEQDRRTLKVAKKHALRIGTTAPFGGLRRLTNSE